MAPRVGFDRHPYGAVAFCYDELAALYSLGAIERSKAHHLTFLSTGDRVLYVGVGRGRDALAAARRGARVTAIDLAPGMLSRLTRERDDAGLDVALVEGDVSRYRPEQSFDVVVASCFLNLFAPEATERMFAILRGLVRPGGRLCVADFAPAVGGAWGRAVTSAYYRPLNMVAWALGLCALRPIPEYTELLTAHAMTLEAEERFPVGPGRDPAYLSLIARRSD